MRASSTLPTAAPDDASARPDDAYATAMLQAAVPELGSGEWNLVSCRARIHKRMRKRFVLLTVEYTVNGRREASRMLAKVYDRDRGGHALASLRAVWDAGFRPPAACRVPRPYGYSSRFAALVQERVRGRQWADALAGTPGELRDGSRAAADWLVRLQDAGVAVEAARDDRRRTDVGRFVNELAEIYPQASGALERVGSQVADAVAAPAGERVPSHGDYHPENVFVDWPVTTVIDFDTFGRREPAWDVGYAIGQLLIVSRFRHGSFGAGAAAADEFWRGYRECGTAGWPRVRAHVARTFFQSLHYELCTLRNGRVELLTVWPAVAERALAADERRPIADLVRGL